MAETINGINVPFLPVGGVDALKERPAINVPEERSFETVLSKELNGIKFSKHAQQRLDSRNIQLSDDDMAHLSSAVTKANRERSERFTGSHA